MSRSQNNYTDKCFVVNALSAYPVGMHTQSKMQVKEKILNEDNKPLAFALVALGTTGISTVCDQCVNLILNISKQVLINYAETSNRIINGSLKSKYISIHEVT